MKAVIYKGPNQVATETVDDPVLEKPTDVLIRLTTTNICGSDLHLYEGRAGFEEGRILGHENQGEVLEIGNAVSRIAVGDKVCVPFNIGCGFCANCERGDTAFCQTNNPDPDMNGAAYGYANMGSYRGGQAEYLRVPYGDFNCLVLPGDADEKANHYAMLSDIFPTGWHATRLAGLQPGESIVIYGAGPVGLMAAHSAYLQGASRVMVVDDKPDRLEQAEAFGAEAIDFSECDAPQRVMELTGGQGADRGCECVGYQACGLRGEEVPNKTMNALVQSVKFTGGIGVVGVFVPEDPGAATDLAKEGKIAFDIGTWFTRGQTMGGGQCSVKMYNRRLAALIHSGRATPGDIVTQEISLDEAADAYKHFGDRDEGWIKVVFKPAA
ncbi:MAG TPA: glutathione-independent formaldehyde dehydrogenase [Longimicrobiales bacterium]|nr:glutathione-independent formaldehyde dehydrogenase [Longimicrobiales bacterium]